MDGFDNFNQFDEAVNRCMDGHVRAITELINNNHESTNAKLNVLIKDNDLQNKRIEKLEESFHVLDKNFAVCKKDNTLIIFLKKHPVKLLWILFFVISIISHYDPITAAGGNPQKLWEFISKLF